MFANNNLEKPRFFIKEYSQKLTKLLLKLNITKRGVTKILCGYNVKHYYLNKPFCKYYKKKK